jgi:hypothetical protein
MALVFERIATEGIAALSYLVGDDSEGVAAVFDPTYDTTSMSSSPAARMSPSPIFLRRIFTPI